MHVWRLASNRYNPLDGEGARLAGGRWNPVGVPAIYASTHLSLALLELLVHVSPERIPDDITAFELDVPDADVEIVRDPPRGWNDVTPQFATIEFGATWLASRRSLMLLVPSVVVPQEYNCLLNPMHVSLPRVHLVGSTPFRFDPRFVHRRP